MDQVKTACRLLEITPQKLAKALNVSVDTIGDWAREGQADDPVTFEKQIEDLHAQWVSTTEYQEIWDDIAKGIKALSPLITFAKPLKDCMELLRTEMSRLEECKIAEQNQDEISAITKKIESCQAAVEELSIDPEKYALVLLSDDSHTYAEVWNTCASIVKLNDLVWAY